MQRQFWTRFARPVFFGLTAAAVAGMTLVQSAWRSDVRANEAERMEAGNAQPSRPGYQSPRSAARRLARRRFRLLALDGRLVKWGVPKLGVGASVTYALATGRIRSNTARNCRDIGPFERIASTAGQSAESVDKALNDAFKAWEAVADIKFVRVEDAAKAQIVIGAQMRPRGRAFANVAPRPKGLAPSDRRWIMKGMGDGDRTLRAGEWAGRSRPVAEIEKALVCLNPSQEWKLGYDGDLDVYDLRHTFTHEIGHAIGLDHPGVRRQLMDFRYNETFKGLQIGDIEGIRRLYGPPER